MTGRSYYNDAYRRTFDARVVSYLNMDGRPAVILDHTFFYPASGGQPADRGYIDEVPVVDVFIREEDGAIVHVLGGEVFEELVHGAIDWDRRFDHMQQHTGQHILSQAFIHIANAHTVGFHMSDNSVTIDLDRNDLAPEEIERAELLANEIVWEDREVTTRVVSPAQADELPIRKVPEVDGNVLRLVEIGGFDLNACGGTHVARTGSVGLIKIVKLERRGDELRVEFCCGRRALVDYRRKNRVVNRLSTNLTTGYLALEQAVEKLQEEAKQARREFRRQQVELSAHVAARLLRSAQRTGEARVVVHAFEDSDPEEVRLIARHLVDRPGVVALLGIAGSKAQLIFARSQDAPGVMRELIKPALHVLGNAAGGGSETYAQGGGPAADRARVEQALARAERLLLAQAD
jgi:alanyl-tRNA synthetase